MEPRRSRQPREGQVAQRARQVAQAGPEGPEASLLQRLEIAAIAGGMVGTDPAGVTDEPQSPREGGGEDGTTRQRRSPPRRAADEHQIEDAPRSHGDADGPSEQRERRGDAGEQRSTIGRPAHGRAIREDHRDDHEDAEQRDRKSTRLNSSHGYISYAVFCLKKKKTDR